jgi:5-keto 4-deoxyuronate isomerase
MLTCMQIIAIVMDNASNNNTMMTALARRHEERYLYFSAEDARMRCMPHTIHLAAIKACFLIIDIANCV